MSRKKTLEEFKKEVYQIFGDEVEVLGEYINIMTKIEVRYKSCGHTNMKTPTKLLAGQGCGLCKNKTISKAKLKSTESYIERLKLKNIDYIKVMGEYTGSNKKIKVQNLKCNHIYEAIAHNILHGSGCPKCKGLRDTEGLKKELFNKYGNAYEVLGEYTHNRAKIKTKHKCGYVWEALPHTLLRKETCPHCQTSKGELFVKRYLEQNNIEYIWQYRIEDCRDILPLPFDFMIKINGEIKLIEFDGQQHFYKGNRYYTDKLKEHDKIKNQYCKSQNIDLLRIKFSWLDSGRITKELDKFVGKQSATTREKSRTP